ncbi:hypothetical protein EBQ90_05145 [bacterium]|nr:hypothetical protein [bacterium]
MNGFSSVAKQYLAERSVSKTYSANVTRIAGRCRDMTTSEVNGHLRARMAVVAASTASSERSILLTLWKFAYERGIVEAPPRGVMRIRHAKSPTKAWTIEQLQLAIQKTYAKDSHRLRSGASLGVFLRCWILFGYECGARMGDIFSMTKDNVDGEILRWTQSKTGDPLSKVLSQPCVEAVQSMLASSLDGTILGWACHKRQAMRLMKSHLKSCGLPGTSKWLRRSGATHIEIDSPGKAQLHLGHRTVGLAATNYIDWGQVRRMMPRTPQLLGSS